MDAIASPADTSEAEEFFHWPVPALFADLDCGSGSVRLTEGFQTASPLIRHRVLRDWLKTLRTESDRTLVEMFREFTGSLERVSIVEQVDLFKRSCKERDITVPTDFAVLLQRV